MSTVTHRNPCSCFGPSCFLRPRRRHRHRPQCRRFRLVIHGHRFIRFHSHLPRTSVPFVTIALNAGDNEAVKIAGALEKNSTMKCINLANNHIKVCIGSPLHRARSKHVHHNPLFPMLLDQRRQCSRQSSSRPRSRLSLVGLQICSQRVQGQNLALSASST
jgi:hypothetical protein